MSGIAGVFGVKDRSTVEKMLEIQGARGPQGQGLCADGINGVLGHSQQQPVLSENRAAMLVADSRIYNQGHKTILHVFGDRGLQTPRFLDGVFAFAITTGDRLVLARDRIGVKPLYYGKDRQGAFYFASEAKALAWVVSDIKEFPTGTIYDSTSGFHPYYQLSDVTPLDLDLDDQIRRLKWTIEASVEKRMPGDEPLGVFLHGDAGSSVIAALARKQRRKLHTFAAGLQGSEDLQTARRVADHIGSIHHEHVYSIDELVEHLAEIIYRLESFDRDLVRSAIPTWFCARLAKEHVTAALVGDGADELFAGYAYHRNIRDLQALHKELHRSVGCLHNVHLQRLDRMTMSHGIEARIPLLDVDVIAVAQAIPPNYKMRAIQNGLCGQWIFRKTFEDLLPKEMIWDDKHLFNDERVDPLSLVLTEIAKDIDATAYISDFPGDGLRDREECLYHQMLCSQYEKPREVIAVTGRSVVPVGT